MQWVHLCILDERVESVPTVAAGGVAYVHAGLVEAMACKDEVGDCAEVVSEYCSWTRGRGDGSRLRGT